jgi:hypothetical protein
MSKSSDASTSIPPANSVSAISEAFRKAQENLPPDNLRVIAEAFKEASETEAARRAVMLGIGEAISKGLESAAARGQAVRETVKRLTGVDLRTDTEVVDYLAAQYGWEFARDFKRLPDVQIMDLLEAAARRLAAVSDHQQAGNKRSLEPTTQEKVSDEYHALLTEWKQSLAKLGDWKGDPTKENEFIKLGRRFARVHQALLMKYEVSSTDFPEPTEIKTWHDPSMPMVFVEVGENTPTQEGMLEKELPEELADKEYRALVAEWNERLTKLGNWKETKEKRDEFKTLVKRFDFNRFAISAKLGIPLSELPYPPEIQKVSENFRKVLEPLIEITAGGDPVTHFQQVCYWYRKLEGYSDNHPVTLQAIADYLVARHSVTRQEVDKMTMGEIAFVLRQDYERQQAAREKPKEASHLTHSSASEASAGLGDLRDGLPEPTGTTDQSMSLGVGLPFRPELSIPVKDNNATDAILDTAAKWALDCSRIIDTIRASLSSAQHQQAGLEQARGLGNQVGEGRRLWAIVGGWLAEGQRIRFWGEDFSSCYAAILGALTRIYSAALLADAHSMSSIPSTRPVRGRSQIEVVQAKKRLADSANTKVSKLTFPPGAIVYRGHRQPLTGKPWQVLKAIAEAPDYTLSLDDLLKKVWSDTVIGEEAVRRHVYTARKALRTLMRTAHVKRPDDPIPAVDRGTNRTAWHLALP